MTVKVTVYTDTYLRTGGFREGPDNRIGTGTLPEGEYEALAQSPGEEIEEGDYRNYWWVRLRTPRGEGWVTAVHVATGHNNKPIPPVHGVAIPERPTVFEATGTSHGPMVKVWKDTPLRRGGSTKDPENHLGQDDLPAGHYQALAQCVGEEFTDGQYHNYWWVYLSTSWGRGWVTAVHVATGHNDKPIPPVDGVPIPEVRTIMV